MVSCTLYVLVGRTADSTVGGEYGTTGRNCEGGIGRSP